LSTLLQPLVTTVSSHFLFVSSSLQCLSSHSLHIFLTTTPSFRFMFPLISFSFTCSYLRLLLPEFNLLGTTLSWWKFSSLTWASSSFILFYANSLHIWFSTLRLFTLSWSTQLSFSMILCIAFNNILDCITFFHIELHPHTLCVLHDET